MQWSADRSDRGENRKEARSRESKNENAETESRGADKATAGKNSVMHKFINGGIRNKIGIERQKPSERRGKRTVSSEG